MNFNFCKTMMCEKLTYDELGGYKCKCSMFGCVFSAKFYVYWLNKKGE